MPPFRICMVTTFYPPHSFGGDADFVFNLANALAERGHDVTVVHCIDSFALGSSERTACEDSRKENRVKVIGFRSRGGFLSPLATHQTGVSLFNRRRLREILSAGFDVIHYHNVSLVGGPDVLRLGNGVKLYTTHEYWLVCPTHTMMRFNREPCLKPSCLLCTLAHKRPVQWWRYSGLLRRAASRVDKFLAPSRFAIDVHHRMGFDASFVHMPNFVRDIEEEHSCETAVAENRYFLYVGRLEKIKGLHTVLPLFRKTICAGLYIAGKGSYEAPLRRLGAGCTNIRFLGYQTREQVRSLMKKALALIVPSLCFELFPLVILEAFRERLPVVVRDSGSLREIVQSSGGGLTFTTCESLETCIHQLMSQPRLRSMLGERGYAMYKGPWSERVHLKRYESLVRQLLPVRDGRPHEKGSGYAR